MKLFSILFLASSITASTILSPLYDIAAQQIISTIKGQLGSIKDQISNTSGETGITVIEQFETALDGLEPAEVVDILKAIPVEQLMEGGLTADDVAEIFKDTAAMDSIDFSVLSDQMIQNLDADQKDAFVQGMDSMLQVAGSVQELFDSEITISNFVGVFTDVIDAASRMNGIYGTTSETTRILQQVLLWGSLLTEKALYFWENYQDFIYMFEDAVMLTKLEFERRIQNTLDDKCSDEFNAVNLALDITKFSGSVVIDNWSGPVRETADIWNTFIGNIPYIDDWKLQTTMVDKIEWYVQMIADSVEGSLTEVRILLLPLRGVIDSTVQNLLGC